MGEVGWKVLGHVLTAVVTGAVLAWLGRQRRAEAAPDFGASVLRYPAGWRAFSWLGLLILGVAPGLALWRFPPPPEDLPVVIGVLGALSAMAAALLLEASGVAHRLGPNAFQRVTPWRRRLDLPWTEVTTVRYLPSAQMWRIAGRGAGTWLSDYLSGLPAFARAVLERVPREVLLRDPPSFARLIQLAGDLDPSVGRRHEG